MTTPLISTTLPTFWFWPLFWSGMCLLERRFGCGGQASAGPPARDSESSEAIPLPNGPGVLLSVLCHRGHPGRVIEASDVRGDERREHRSNSIRRRACRYGPLVGSWRTGPPRSERLAAETRICCNAFRCSSAAEVRRFMVSMAAGARLIAAGRTCSVPTELERTAEVAR